MKTMMIISAIFLLGTVQLRAGSPKEDAVKTTILGFAKAADKSDVSKLSSYLDDNYQIVMNRLFGSESVSIMPKAVYLKKIESKEWGGDNRQVTIKSILVNGSLATAQVEFKGKKSSFTSLLSLVEDGSGNWKLISDMPYFQ